MAMNRTAVALSIASCMAMDAMASSLEMLWERDPLWEFTQETFLPAARPLGFKWMTASCDLARCGPREKMTVGGVPVGEAVARFSDGRLSEISAVLYARGDNGEITRGEFEDLIKRSVAAISGVSGVKAQMRGKDLKGAARAEGVVWQTARTQLLLEYAISRVVTATGVNYRPEFVRLEISPLNKRQPAKELVFASKSDAKPDFRTKVKKSSGGDVWISGVPMVDQGDKSYCLVASAERVLRYYGMRVDQNELAQLVGTDRWRGTDLKAAQEGLRQAGGRLRFKVKMEDEPDLREFEALVQDYNRRSTRFGKKLQVITPQGDVDPFQVMAEMQLEALKETRLAQRAKMARFLRSVMSSVDAGQPLLWGVALGVVPEAGLVQKSGGHVRLILGYNPITNEILYSDSWGAGHELKRMTASDAWIIHSFSLGLTPW